MKIIHPPVATKIEPELAQKFVMKNFVAASDLCRRLDNIMSNFAYSPKPTKLEALFIDPADNSSGENMRVLFCDANKEINNALRAINNQCRAQPELMPAMRKELITQMKNISEWVNIINMPEDARSQTLQDWMEKNSELVYSREFTLRGIQFTPIAIPSAMAMNG